MPVFKLILLVFHLGGADPEPAPYDWPVQYQHEEACHEIGQEAIMRGQAFLRDPDGGSPSWFLVLAYRCEFEDVT